MEREVGVKLFERNNRNVKLTPLGVQFYMDISNVLEKYDQTLKNLQSLETGFHGTLRIGIGAYEGMFVSPLLRVFHDQYPGIQVALKQYAYAQLWDNIVSGKLDIVFMNSFYGKDLQDLPKDEVKVYDLFEFSFGLIVHQLDSLAKCKMATAEEIKQYCILTYTSMNTWETLPSMRNVSFRPKQSIQFNSFATLESMVRADYGIGIMPCFMESKLPEDIVMIDQNVLPKQRYFAMVSRKQSNPSKDYFLNIIRTSTPLWKKMAGQTKNE